MSNTNTAKLMVNAFDERRRPVDDIDRLITISNGFQEQLHRDYYHKAPSIPFDVPFHNNAGDNYSVIVYTKGFDKVRFFPVTVNPKVLQHADLMFEPAYNRWQ